MNYTATAGQSCGSTSRLLLHESVADQVLDAGGGAGPARSAVGHPLAEGTQMGPVISRNQYDKSISAITGRDRGGRAGLSPGWWAARTPSAQTGGTSRPPSWPAWARDNPAARRGDLRAGC